ncbi:MAG: hypothetical protein KDB07_01475 [Planctomycetes bacterium]|nr:hypothetical protein [Planctomycetota bacterium]
MASEVSGKRFPIVPYLVVLGFALFFVGAYLLVIPSRFEGIVANHEAELRELEQLNAKWESELRDVRSGRLKPWLISEFDKDAWSEIEKRYEKERLEIAKDDDELKGIARARNRESTPARVSQLKKQKKELERRYRGCLDALKELRVPPPTGASEEYMQRATKKFAELADLSLQEFKALWPAFEAFIANNTYDEAQAAKPEAQSVIQAYGKWADRVSELEKEFPLFFPELEHRKAELPEPALSKDREIGVYVNKLVAWMVPSFDPDSEDSEDSEGEAEGE